MKLRLTRLQIPDFKIFKDLDMSFDSGDAFPICGKNGSGKSLLLQLIFTLLGCAFDSAKSEYVKQVLALSEDLVTTSGTIARLTLDFDDRPLILHFWAIKDANLTDIQRERARTPLGLRRYQDELAPEGFYPCCYVAGEYLLAGEICWSEAPTEVIDRQTIARILGEIGRRVFIGIRASDLPLMLPANGSRVDYYRLVDKLPFALPHFIDLDRELGWQLSSLSSATFAGIAAAKVAESVVDWCPGGTGAVVLLDGIEQGLDADNQFEIISQLQKCLPECQLLLATTSFELTQAVPSSQLRGL